METDYGRNEWEKSGVQCQATLVSFICSEWSVWKGSSWILFISALLWFLLLEKWYTILHIPRQLISGLVGPPVAKRALWSTQEPMNSPLTELHSTRLPGKEKLRVWRDGSAVTNTGVRFPAPTWQCTTVHVVETCMETTYPHTWKSSYKAFKMIRC